MAERRMFAKTIIDSDAFIDMPVTARLLYYDLGMRADDDGFVNSPKKIMRMIGASEDDMRILITRKFIIPFESGVVVIKHWRIHNYIQNDRHKETTYKEEMALLEMDENKAYTLKENGMYPECIQNGYEVDTQDRLGKVSISKVSIGKDIDRLGKDNLIVSNETICRTDVQRIVDAWNAIGVSQITKLNPKSRRYQMLIARLKEYGVDDVLDAIDNVKQSDFLQGRGEKYFLIDFEWFVKPNNFPKVLEGKYRNRLEGQNDNGIVRGTLSDRFLHA